MENFIKSRISLFFYKYSFQMSNLMYFQENRIGRAFVYISFEKLYQLGQPYKLGQKL